MAGPDSPIEGRTRVVLGRVVRRRSGQLVSRRRTFRSARSGCSASKAERRSTPGLSIDQLPAYGGDRLVIVGELPISTRDDEDCKRVFEDLEEDLDERQIWFPIIRAFNDQLEIWPVPEPRSVHARGNRAVLQPSSQSIK